MKKGTDEVQAYVIPPTYDSMIAKLIAYGKDRQELKSRPILKATFYYYLSLDFLQPI
ncbi:hypothetical protein [Clostridium sp. DJ247]|uniref:hypothetical protein n=1 Tax=Clostridium sp. DJ247 TaxID=2726188 RepID=UPI0016234F1B|nr:hypothetical protein [Clostridium sp. DJ247]MBC2578811.1 hypothetical protein [Clostridium sp. DJ247]